jgi:putative FmdB family regulatory protein
MPTYVYESVDKVKSCKICADGFETEQGIKEPALTKCPKCGSPIRRVITTVNISTARSTKEILSDKNIKKHGFTKLVNEGNGKFRKI